VSRLPAARPANPRDRNTHSDTRLPTPDNRQPTRHHPSHIRCAPDASDDLGGKRSPSRDDSLAIVVLVVAMPVVVFAVARDDSSVSGLG